MAKTKSVDGKPHPSSDFAYVGDPDNPATWSLPDFDAEHVRLALDLFSTDHVIPASAKSGVAAKLATKAKAMGIDTTNFKKAHLGEEAVAKLEGQWIEAFRAGDHGSKGGVFTAADIDKIVDSYNPDEHEAPIACGHSEAELAESDRHAAYGWVEKLKRVGNSLFFKLKQVNPDFADAVESGAFKKRSVGLYRRDGKWSLRHIAFLGAAPPHIKGMADAVFHDENAEVVQITFQEETQMPEIDEKKLFDRLLEAFAERFLGKKSGESVVLSEAAAKAEVASLLEEQMRPIREAEAARKAAFDDSQKKMAAAEAGTRVKDAIASLKTKGSWVPAFDKLGLPQIFAELAGRTETVEFGEGDAKKQVTPLELMVGFMEGLGKIVPNGHVVQQGNAKPGAEGGVVFSENSHRADPNSIVIAQETKKLMATAKAAGRTLEYGEAMNQVVAANPQLAIPGGASAGAV